MDAQIEEKKKHVAALIAHTEKLVRGYAEVLSHAKTKLSDPIVLDRLQTDAEAAAGAMGVLANRAGDLASDLLDG